jgi:phosphotransferase system enzyme I (PtsI)
MAGEPAYTLILIGLELDELSMNPLAIPRVKKIIRNSTYSESKSLLKKVMAMSSAIEIENYIKDYMSRRFPDVISKTEESQKMDNSTRDDS